MNWTTNAEQAANLKALRVYALTRLSAFEYEPNKFSGHRKTGCLISQAYHDRALPEPVLEKMDKEKGQCVNNITVFNRAEKVLNAAYGDGAFDYFNNPAHDRIALVNDLTAVIKASGFKVSILEYLREYTTPRKITVILILAALIYGAKLIVVGFVIGSYIAGVLINNRWNPVALFKGYFNLFRRL